MAWLRTRDIKDSQITNPKLSNGMLRTLKFTYDFSVAGGAIGVIALTDDRGNAQQLPDNAVVVSSHVEVLTGVTSAGAATVAFGIGGTPALFLAATGKASLGAGVALLGEHSTPAKLPADRRVIATVATAALTAGKFNVWVRYYQGD